MEIEMAIQKFLDELSRTKAKTTHETYENGIKVLRKYLYAGLKLQTTSPLNTLTMEHMIGFASYLSYEGFSKKTVAVYLSSVRAFVEWLIIDGVMAPTYQETLRFQKAFRELQRRRESKLPRWPKKDDVEKMLEAARQLKEPPPRRERDIAIIEVLSCTGCRIDELSKLDIDHIDMAELSAVVTGKGSKERIVYLGQSAVTALQQYWSVRGESNPSSPAFCRYDKGAGKKIKRMGTETIWNVVRDVMAIAGVQKFSPHYFRHAFAIRMLRETNNLAIVQDLLGHASPQSTRVYAKIYPDELKEAHRKVYQ